MNKSFFKSRSFKIFIAITLFLVFFKKSIETLLIHKFGSAINSINTGTWTWYIVVSLFIWYITSANNRLKRGYFSTTITQLYLIITIFIYVYYRHNSNTWVFLPNNFPVKYLDALAGAIAIEILIGMPKIDLAKNSYNLEKDIPTIMVFLFYSLAVWLISPFDHTGLTLVITPFLIILLLFLSGKLHFKKDNTKKDPSKGFLEDLPLPEAPDKREEEHQSHKIYAQNLAQRLNDTTPQKAFAIGINGKWGSGKTSFLKGLKTRIKEKINSNEIVEIDFQPWNSHTPEAITTDFFDTFQTALAPYNSSLARSILVYSNKLNAINNNKKTKYLQAIVHFFTGVVSLQELHKNINDTLQKVDKKVFIYIDDLDRLNAKEVMAVLRLVRNSANFYNIFFLVAYDRDYINMAIKDQNMPNNEVYLEKIFQLEINLPYFEPSKLKNQLIKLLKSKLPSIKEDELKNLSINFDLLNTPRDITRLVNGIVLNFEEILEEVVLKDLIHIEILRMKYPSVYSLLKNDRQIFLSTSSKYPYHLRRGEYSENDYYYKNLYEGDQRIWAQVRRSGTEEPIKAPKPYTLQLHLQKYHKILSVPESKIERIIGFLMKLFPENNSNHDLKHITKPSKFNRYFRYGLERNDFSEIEFSKARDLDISAFKAKIDEWIENRLTSDLKERFEKIDEYDSFDDYKKIIEAFFYLCRKKNHDLSGFKELLKHHEKYDKNESKEFFLSLFKDAKTPAIYEADFLYWSEQTKNAKPGTKKLSEIIPLTPDELEEIRFEYFKEYSQKTSSINQDLITLFFLTKVIKTNKMPEAAQKIMQDFANKDINEFLAKSIIHAQHFQIHEEGLAFDTYGGQQKFEAEIIDNKALKGKEIEEFRSFYEKCRASHFKHIPYDFKYLNPLQFSKSS